MEHTIYSATSNLHKLAEFRQALLGICDVEQVPGIAGLTPPEETGSTFEENAALKAVYYSQDTKDLVFADDSGIEVDALHGAPGVYSARYAGPDATDAANNRLLLEQMRSVSDRTARFVCVIAVAREGEVVATFRGSVEGVLLEEERGEHGFGYDPLFFYPPFGGTFAETSRERKTGVSHRGQALAKMVEWLRAGAEPIVLHPNVPRPK